MANHNMFVKTMAQVTEENLDMDNWGKKFSSVINGSCRTTMCLAGHAVVAAGFSLMWERERMNDEFGNPVYDAAYTTTCESVEDLAQELLGLTDEQATALFFETSAQTPQELWDAITEVTGVQAPQLTSV